jgi:hypothetical protein
VGDLETILTELDEQQRAAALALPVSAAILVGAGTRKTTTLNRVRMNADWTTRLTSVPLLVEESTLEETLNPRRSIAGRERQTGID